MNAASVDIKDILVDELGLEFGTNLFIGVEPTDPANTVTIFDTPGFAPDVNLERSNKYERPSVQVRVRNLDYQIGMALIDSIKSTLHARANETWGGTFYTLVAASNDPSLLDHDQHDRPRFIINFNIQRVPL